MTLNKAIETLTTITKHGYWTMTPINSDAIQLGIEALAFIAHWRQEGHMFCEEPLPGETEGE